MIAAVEASTENEESEETAEGVTDNGEAGIADSTESPSSKDKDAPPLGKMELTDEEREWAKAIKTAVEADSELENLSSDFEYVLHALVAKKKVTKALARIRRMQNFKAKYGIEGDGDIEQGVSVLKSFLLENQPNFLLSVGKDTSGRMVQLFDYKAFDPKRITTEEEWKILLGGLYYLFHASSPDFGSIREGFVFVADCLGMGWKNFSFEIEKRGADFYQDCYPVRMKQIAMLNAPSIFHVMYNICKVFLSQKIRSVMHLTTTQKYLAEKEDLIPKDALPVSMEGTCTQDDVLKRLTDGLQERYENSKNFSL